MTFALTKKYGAGRLLRAAAPAHCVVHGHLAICHLCGLEAAGAGQGIQFSQQDIIDIWRGRTGLCLTPSYARHSLRHQFEHLAFGGSDNLPEGLQPRLKMKRLIARLLASEDTEI